MEYLALGQEFVVLYYLMHERKNLDTLFKSATIFEEEVVQKDVKSGARLIARRGENKKQR